MFKIAIDKDFQSARVVQNDRGEWEPIKEERSYHYTFVGFGGENVVTVHLMTMQSGRSDVVVVHSPVDGYHQVVHESALTGFDVDALNDFINGLIAKVIDYPEEL